MPRYTSRGWQWLTRRIFVGGTVSVASVFGRVGNVVAVLGDYTSSLVTNLSGVAGATVTAALDALNSTPRPWLFAGATTLGNTTSARYIPTVTTVAVSATEAGSGWVVPCPGFIKNLAVNLTTALAAAGTTVNVRVNGAATGITCNIPATTRPGSDITHSFAVVVGDIVTFETVTSVADNTTSNIRVSLGFSKAA